MTYLLTDQNPEVAQQSRIKGYREIVNQHFRGLPPLRRETVELVATHYLRVPSELVAPAISDIAVYQTDRE